MHIVLVCREYVGSSRAGGIASYLEEISKAYIDLDHKVTIVTASEDTRVDCIENINSSLTIIRVAGGDFINPNIEHQNLINRFRFLYRFKSYRRRLRNVIMSIPNADVIEVADYGAEGLYLQDIGVPVVLRLHSPLSLDIRTLTKARNKIINIPRYLGVRAEEIVFDNAQYISSCSEVLLSWVRDSMNINPRLTSVVNNPINTKNRSVNSDNSKDLTIFYGGTICETKGVGDLIDASKILRAKGVNIKLELAGKGGVYYNLLKKKALKNNWTWITFLGKLNREEMFIRYKSSTLCCFPSWWENMPMVCLEAMGVGAIVIASSSGGAKEIISDSINGFIIDRKNPKMLADCIERVLSMDKKILSDISSKAKQHIRSNFNPPLIATQMLSFYKTVIDDSKSNIYISSSTK